MRDVFEILAIFGVFFAGMILVAELRPTVAEAQIPADLPRCQVHTSANNIVQCQLPNGVTCFYKEAINAVSMDCLE